MSVSSIRQLLRNKDGMSGDGTKAKQKSGGRKITNATAAVGKLV